MWEIFVKHQVVQSSCFHPSHHRTIPAGSNLSSSACSQYISPFPGLDTLQGFLNNFRQWTWIKCFFLSEFRCKQLCRWCSWDSNWNIPDAFRKLQLEIFLCVHDWLQWMLSTVIFVCWILSLLPLRLIHLRQGAAMMKRARKYCLYNIVNNITY